MDIDRALSKLKFDESVSGYCLLTNDGDPFLSFSMPEDVFPQIRAALRIHSSSLKLMNIMTDQGIVILARVNPEWVLAVIFAEQQLGIALQNTRNVVRLLSEADLPPPPKPAETAVEEAQVEAAVGPESKPVQQEPAAESVEIAIEDVRVAHGCVVHYADRYTDAMVMGSELNRALRSLSPTAIDVLLMVDEERTVFKISEILAKPVDEVIRVVRWCVSKRIVTVECPEEQESGPRVIVEVPLFKGNLSKVKKNHRRVIELCNGNLTLNEIAAQLGMTYFEALQCVIPYRGKSLEFVKIDKVVDSR